MASTTHHHRQKSRSNQDQKPAILRKPPPHFSENPNIHLSTAALQQFTRNYSYSIPQDTNPHIKYLDHDKAYPWFTALELLKVFNRSRGTAVDIEGFRPMINAAREKRVIENVGCDIKDTTDWQFTKAWVEGRGGDVLLRSWTERGKIEGGGSGGSL
ncbi:hypothetical protein GLAREA_09594 [Glarea lozoyensis ATCC 20868]|uniref:Uncharacterized protein n=1 Tax=Glarea lozoyensis (strain ATCC 20868 / MF5171) TaxID=1116229 RepID=S3DPS7_GLAL2|nr:uncharacterized protein GLAREA_09594 [Glarea lozoyensis ATCC 20868]EPE28473.1 hypothetical protein GLAREA_09594 [Glarea lozoyensis ATCC 20868]